MAILPQLSQYSAIDGEKRGINNRIFVEIWLFLLLQVEDSNPLFNEPTMMMIFLLYLLF